MTDRRITRQVTETSSQPLPGNALTELRGEVLSRAGAGSLTAELAAETASAPWPPDRAATWLAEVLAKPWPPLIGPVFVVEVLRAEGQVGFWKVAIKPGKPFVFGRLDNTG